MAVKPEIPSSRLRGFNIFIQIINYLLSNSHSLYGPEQIRYWLLTMTILLRVYILEIVEYLKIGKPS